MLSYPQSRAAPAIPPPACASTNMIPRSMDMLRVKAIDMLTAGFTWAPGKHKIIDTISLVEEESKKNIRFKIHFLLLYNRIIYESKKAQSVQKNKYKVIVYYLKIVNILFYYFLFI